ncbi:MAG: hypothetical protein RLZZ627_1262 [Pseudomonadota bacterium]|jgi:hypothetical protein
MVNYLVRSEVLRELALEINGDLSDGQLNAILCEFGELSCEEIGIITQSNRSAVQAASIVGLRKAAKKHSQHRAWLEPDHSPRYYSDAGWPAGSVN